MNGLPKTMKQERFADKEKKNPSSMSFIVSFRGDLQYEGTISIYYAEKSIKNTPRGCYSLNDSLFEKYAEKGLKKMGDTVNSQLKLCRENRTAP